MIDEILNIDEVTEAYLFANNAMSLLRALKNSNSINVIATRISSEELDEEFARLLGSDITTYEEVAKLYSLYVAMAMKPRNEVSFFFDKYRELDFEWFPNIRKNIYESASLVTRANFDETLVGHLPNVQSGETTKGSTSRIILIN